MGLKPASETIKTEIYKRISNVRVSDQIKYVYDNQIFLHFYWENLVHEFFQQIPGSMVIKGRYMNEVGNSDIRALKKRKLSKSAETISDSKASTFGTSTESSSSSSFPVTSIGTFSTDKMSENENFILTLNGPYEMSKFTTLEGINTIKSILCLSHNIKLYDILSDSIFFLFIEQKIPNVKTTIISVLFKKTLQQLTPTFLGKLFSRYELTLPCLTRLTKHNLN